MEKRMVQAHIECNNTGFYTVYCEEDSPFGFFGEGFSADEARVDFVECFKAMRDDYFEQTGEFIDAEFTFVYDASAFLQHYKGILTLSGMSRMTGINKAQLSQYVCGKRHPSPRTQEKIKRSVQKFAEMRRHTGTGVSHTPLRMLNSLLPTAYCLISRTPPTFSPPR